MRAFVSVDLPEKLLDALDRLQEGLPGRHVAAENLHLTLAFLGDVGEAALRDLAEALAEERLAAPELKVTGLDVFGGRKPGLCFAAVAPAPELEAARAAVLRACRAAGIALRRERFRPHVTLSRFGTGLGGRDEARLAARLGPLDLPGERAESFGLYRSELGPGGPVYTELAGFGFE